MAEQQEEFDNVQFAQTDRPMLVDTDIQRRRQAILREQEAFINVQFRQSGMQMLVDQEIERSRQAGAQREADIKRRALVRQRHITSAEVSSDHDAKQRRYHGKFSEK